MKENMSNLKNVCQHPPKHNNMKVIATKEKSALNLYLINSGGFKYYLMTHRQNGLLWALLKNGMYLDELRRFRPIGDRRRKKAYSSVHHILEVIDSFLKYELSA